MSITVTEILQALADKKVAYSIDSLQKDVDVGRSTIYEELNAGRLQAKKCNKQTLIPFWSVILWIDALPNYTPGQSWVRKKPASDEVSTLEAASNSSAGGRRNG